MGDRRRATGFERLGAGGAGALGWGASRARALAIETAWRRAAGPSIARRATVARVRRGILEIEVGEGAWRRAVARLLPEITARLAEDAPSLRISGIRIVDASRG